MNTWPSIRREAALALSPDDMAKGNKELDALIESAARSIAKRETLFALAYGLSVAVLFVSCVAYLIYANRKPPSALMSNLALAVALSSVFMLALLWWAWAAIQHERIAKRVGDLSGLTIPPPLQELIDSFASEVRDARTASGNTVQPSLFASCWAIMLFSHDERQRLWVRSPRGAKQRQEIFARPDQPELAQPAEAIVVDDAAEPPLRNSHPAMDWLVNGTPQRFAAGLNKFIDTLPPHQEAAYRAIFTIARRELRKGGQPGAQEAAIRIILTELDQKGLRIRGTSRATIMKLLHGQHRGADIRGYFA